MTRVRRRGAVAPIASRVAARRYERFWAEAGVNLLDGQGIRESQALPLIEASTTTRVDDVRAT